MPAKSPAQKRLMDAAAHNPAFAKKVGIPSKVAKEFSKESKGMTFQKGGEMKESKKMMAKEVAFMKKKGAPKSMIKHEMKEASMKSGGKAYAAGGMMADRPVKEPTYKPLGGVGTTKKPAPIARGRGPIKPLPMPPSRMKSGGAAYAKGGGIEAKGKTKGKMVKMMGGGRAC